MTIWKNSKMTRLYYSKDSALEDYHCIVEIDDKGIVVEYEGDGTVQYRGSDKGIGHYLLRSKTVNGEASLHMFPLSTILEGCWFEGGDRGMWRITLA